MHSSDTLYTSWYGSDVNEWYAVGRFDCRPEGYTFRYLAGAALAKECEGFRGLAQFPDFRPEYESESLFPFIGNRLLSENRPEYQDHTRRLGLEPEDLKPFDVLSRSNGRRATDRYELFAPPHQEGDGSISLHFFVRAVRYRDEPLQELWKEETPDAPLELRREPGNTYDPHAIEIYDSENRKLGYVPRYYTESLSQVVEHDCDYELKLERHNEEPGFARQRFLVHLQADTPHGWHFPQSDQYDDIETVLDSETEAD